MHITRLHFGIGFAMRTSKIQCANLDGSDVKDLVTIGLERPSGIALC